MDALPAAGIAAAAGYLCGSAPFAWLAVRWRTGTDLRAVGSGNVGATNAARVLGTGWFPALFVLDAAKGAGAVFLAILLPPAPGAPADGPAAAAAAGAVLGHVFPVWLGFRGGKAVATGAGTLAALSPLASLAGLAAFLVAVLVGRFVSLASVIGAVAAAAVHFVDVPRGFPFVDGYVVLLAAVVLLRHLPNLRRIAAGTEPRIFQPPAGAGEEASREP